MKKSIVIIILTVITLSGFSQTSARKENVEKLLAITMAGELGVRTSQTMIQSFKGIYKDVPEEFWNEVQKEIKVEGLVSLIVPIYQKHYSDEEITQLIAFYNTPLGKKVIENTPLISIEAQTAGRAWGKAIGEKVVSRMKEKGYFKGE